MAGKPIKVMVAKAALDQDGKEARILARTLKEVGGMDVSYTGLYRSVGEIAEQSITEQAEVILVLVHTAAPMDIFPPLRQALDQRGGQSIAVAAGGHIPQVSKKALLDSGSIETVFDFGTPASTIIEWIKREVSV